MRLTLFYILLVASLNVVALTAKQIQVRGRTLEAVANGDDDDDDDDDDSGMNPVGDDDDDGVSGDDDDGGMDGDDDDDDDDGGDIGAGFEECFVANPSVVHTEALIEISGDDSAMERLETGLRHSIAIDALVPAAFDLIKGGVDETGFNGGDVVYDMATELGIIHAAIPFINPERWPFLMCASYKSWLAGLSVTCNYEANKGILEQVVIEYIDGMIFGLNTVISPTIDVESSDFKASTDCSEFAVGAPAPVVPVPPAPVLPITPAPVAGPTLSPLPPSPGHPPCSVCGEELEITLPNVIVFIPTVGNITCFRFQRAGDEGFIQEDFCPGLPSLAAPCGCAPISAR